MYTNSTGFPGDVCFAFFNVPPGNKDAVKPNPLTEEQSHCVYNCDNERLKMPANMYSQMCFLPVFLFINGVSLQETVVGFIGGSAVLPCSSKELPLTSEDIGVYWRHSSQNVYGIIYGKVSVEGQAPEYRNRTESFPEEYMRGNFSIKLNNLQHNDAGKYQCYIIMEESVIRVELLIEEKQTSQLPSEGTKPRPDVIVMFISVLCTGIIFSLAVNLFSNVTV